MKIFNQIDDIIKAAKSAKSAKEMVNNRQRLSNLAEYEVLINFVSDKLFLDSDDLKAWKLNFEEDSNTTIFCLKLMKKAINQGRFPSHGWLS
jgi:hypothetical protein